jgi:RNA polymerase sigma-70 factor (ECF subfamily)
LSAELADALRVTVVDGLTTAEAARRLGIPAGTVKTRVMRAKAVLRKVLS